MTGRSILFVNPMHTHGFVGMKREEAWPLIEELAAHATQERLFYYHRWRVGDVLTWDERATMPRAPGTAPGSWSCGTLIPGAIRGTCSLRP